MPASLTGGRVYGFDVIVDPGDNTINKPFELGRYVVQ